MSRGQAERLMPMLGEMLSETGHGWAGLDRLAVLTGPGNFTGIRIGVAAARGLALALDIPAVGISGFAVAAFGTTGPVTATVPAPRGQVYVQAPGQDPMLCPLADVPVSGTLCPLDAVPLAERAIRLGRLAQAVTGADAPPVPLYLRPADAAPPADPPPVILSDDA